MRQTSGTPHAAVSCWNLPTNFRQSILTSSAAELAVEVAFPAEYLLSEAQLEKAGYIDQKAAHDSETKRFSCDFTPAQSSCHRPQLL